MALRWRAYPAAHLDRRAEVQHTLTYQPIQVVRREISMFGGGKKCSAQEEPDPAERHSKTIASGDQQRHGSERGDREQPELFGGSQMEMRRGADPGGESGGDGE